MKGMLTWKTSLSISLLLFFLITGCENKSSIPENIIPDDSTHYLIFNRKIASYPEVERIKISEIVRLETLENSLLGDISKVQMIEDKWYIGSMNKLFVFSSSGDFIQTIGQIGEGPGELSAISDFWINSNEKTIFILDKSSSKIMNYRLDGDFITEIKIDHFPLAIASQDSIFLMNTLRPQQINNSAGGHDIIQMNQNIEIENSFFPYGGEYKGWLLPGTIFYEFEGYIHYLDFWNNRVFRWENSGFSPHLKIDFGKNSFPVEYSKTYEDYVNNKSKYTMIFNDLLENENYIYFNITQNSKLGNVFYNKKNREFKILKKGRNNQENLLINPKATIGSDKFVSITKPDLLSDLKEKNLLITPSLLEMADSLEKDDNPFLIVFTIQ